MFCILDVMDSKEAAILRNSQAAPSAADNAVELRTQEAVSGLVSANDAATRDLLEAELRELHQEHSASLYAFARMFSGDTEMAEEALQEAYHRYLLYRSQDRLVLNKRAWMIRVIHNVIVDWKKARARCQELNAEVPAPDSVEAEESSIDQLLERSKVSLSTRERQILDLRLQGLRYSEVARMLGIGEGSVSRYLNRAFSKLRRLRKA